MTSPEDVKRAMSSIAEAISLPIEFENYAYYPRVSLGAAYVAPKEVQDALIFTTFSSVPMRRCTRIRKTIAQTATIVNTQMGRKRSNPALMLPHTLCMDCPAGRRLGFDTQTQRARASGPVARTLPRRDIVHQMIVPDPACQPVCRRRRLRKVDRRGVGYNGAVDIFHMHLPARHDAEVAPLTGPVSALAAGWV